MAEIMTYQVNIIESERGWGSKIDEVRGFLTIEEAETFITEFNSKNTEDKVPETYWYAERKNYTKPIN